MKKLLSLIFLCFLTFIGTIHANLYQTIAKENLKSITEVTASATSEKDILGALINDEKEFYEVLDDNFNMQLTPPPLAKRQFTFSLLSEYEDANNLETSPILDEKTWQDLEMLCGPRSKPSLYLAAQIDRTSTEIGKLMLYRKIIQPTANQHEIRKQQQITKELISNKSLFDELDNRLKKLETPENIFMSFWNDSIFKGIITQCVITLPLEKRLTFLKKISSWLNKSEFAIEINNELNLGTTLIGITFTTMGVISLPLIAASYLTTHTSLDTFKKWNDIYNLSGISKFSIIGGLYLLTQSISKNDNAWTKGGISAATGVKGSLNLWWIFKNIKTGIIIDKIMQEKLIYIATYINSIKEMIQLAKNNEVLSSLIPSLGGLEEKMATLSEKSEDVAHLFRLLKTKTFEGKASYFSHKGRIFSAYRLIHEVKKLIVDMALVTGELDMQMSIARLYKEFDTKQVQFCFPTYINGNSETPSIAAEDFWNPLIDSEVVVPNSLTLEHNNATQNVIITGPNAGGKSTIMKGLVISIILGQSLGIAPAKSLTFTPFSHIMTYLNITDDIAAGNSHFKAGVLRARELVTMIEALEKNEFALTAVDEVFNGTTPKEGEAAAYSMTALLGNHPGNVCLTATHFAKISQLEQETGLFTNYKVSVIENESEKIQYPYILERGISDQIITFKILKEEGFSDDFLIEAQKVLAH